VEAKVVESEAARKQRQPPGGRPKKAAVAPQSQYTTLTGQQRVWAVKEVSEMLSVPGARRQQTFKSVAAKLGCSARTVREVYRDKDVWLEWGIRKAVEGSRKPGSWRKRGCKTGGKRAGSVAKGCRKPVKRGHLGRTDYCHSIAC
jgi:hypothetical protein